jgi:hypothetical protein
MAGSRVSNITAKPRIRPAELPEDLQADVPATSLRGHRRGDELPGLGPGDQLLQGLVRGVGPDEQRVRVNRDPAKRIERLEWLIGQRPLVRHREILAGAPPHQDGVAVGLRLHHFDPARNAAAARLIDYHERLREVLRCNGRDRPRHHIRGPAGAVRHDELNGPVRKIRRLHGVSDSSQEQGRHQHGRHETHGSDLHLVLPESSWPPVPSLTAGPGRPYQCTACACLAVDQRLGFT